jgi:hypothetical protein
MIDEKNLKSVALVNSINPTASAFSLQLFTSGSSNAFSNRNVFVHFIELLDWSYSSATGARLPIDYMNVFFQPVPQKNINDMRSFSLGPGASVLNSVQLKFVEGESFAWSRRSINMLVSSQTINSFSVNIKVPVFGGGEFFVCSFRLYWEELEEKKTIEPGRWKKRVLSDI